MKESKEEKLVQKMSEILRKGLSDKEKTDRLIKAILNEPGELGKKHGHLTRIK
jgi:hypothetical protein